MLFRLDSFVYDLKVLYLISQWEWRLGGSLRKMASVLGLKISLSSLRRKQPKTFSVRIVMMDADLEFSCEVSRWRRRRKWMKLLLTTVLHGDDAVDATGIHTFHTRHPTRHAHRKIWCFVQPSRMIFLFWNLGVDYYYYYFQIDVMRLNSLLLG